MFAAIVFQFLFFHAPILKGKTNNFRVICNKFNFKDINLSTRMTSVVDYQRRRQCGACARAR